MPIMTEAEINTFIEVMEERNDPWTVEQVIDVYGNSTLEDAIKDRLTILGLGSSIIATVASR